MPFLAQLMTKVLFPLFLCLFQIGCNQFSRVMSMTLHYLTSSNAWTTTLLLFHITLGMVLHCDTRVVWCFPRTQLFTKLSSMNSMLLRQRSTLVFSKRMNGNG